MVKQIYEHLITRKKYNTLMLKYNVKQSEYDEKVIELENQKKINKIQKDNFEKEVEDLVKRLKKEKEKNKNKKVAKKNAK